MKRYAKTEIYKEELSLLLNLKNIEIVDIEYLNINLYGDNLIISGIKVYFNDNSYSIFSLDELKKIVKFKRGEHLEAIKITLGDLLNPFKKTERGLYYYKEVIENE